MIPKKVRKTESRQIYLKDTSFDSVFVLIQNLCLVFEKRFCLNLKTDEHRLKWLYGTSKNDFSQHTKAKEEKGYVTL
jgi:hypothetical protein